LRHAVDKIRNIEDIRALQLAVDRYQVILGSKADGEPYLEHETQIFRTEYNADAEKWRTRNVGKNGNVQNINMVTGKVIDEFDDETKIQTVSDVFLQAVVPAECGLRLETKFVMFVEDDYGDIPDVPGTTNSSNQGNSSSNQGNGASSSNSSSNANAEANSKPRPPEHCPQIKTVMMVKELYAFLHKLKELSADTHVLRVTERSISAFSHLRNGVGSVSTNILARNLVN
jgi:hypothetical protein